MAGGKFYIAAKARPRAQRRKKMTLTKKIKTIELRREETKNLITDTGFFSATTSGVLKDLSASVQGIASEQHIGDKIYAMGLDVRYNIEVGSNGLLAAADQYNSVRIIIFQYKEDTSVATIAVNQILDTGGRTLPEMAPYRWDFDHAYKIMYDKTHTVFNTPYWNGANSFWEKGYGAHYDSQTIKFKGKKLHNREIEFDADTTGGKNKYYALIISDSAHAPDPQVCITAQLYYKDS